MKIGHYLLPRLLIKKNDNLSFFYVKGGNL